MYHKHKLIQKRNTLSFWSVEKLSSVKLAPSAESVGVTVLDSSACGQDELLLLYGQEEARGGRGGMGRTGGGRSELGHTWAFGLAPADHMVGEGNKERPREGEVKAFTCLTP